MDVLSYIYKWRFELYVRIQPIKMTGESVCESDYTTYCARAVGAREQYYQFKTTK